MQRDADVPVIVDDVKTHEGFEMTRCTYFTIACDDPIPGQSLGTDFLPIPFTLMGLAGVLTRPPNGDRFDEPESFDELLQAIDENERLPNLYVDVNDLWIPNTAFTDGPARRGDVYRLPEALFFAAVQYRSDLISARSYESIAADYTETLRPSPHESRAFKEWGRRSVEGAKAQYEERAEMALRWEPDARFPSTEEE